jgi:ribosome maturation factor RimP
MEEKIASLLEEKFKEEDLTDCFLVDIKLGTNRKLEVFIDSDTGVDFSTCKKISRFLESHIDQGNWLGEKYILEVSSPGATKPLIMKRQYPKHKGRKLEVKLIEGGTEEGILTEIFEKNIVIQKKERIKEGKKKQTIVRDIEIKFDEIKQAIVKLAFK